MGHSSAVLHHINASYLLEIKVVPQNHIVKKRTVFLPCFVL